MDWSIRSVLAWSCGYLAERGLDNPRLEAELLLCDALRLKRINLYLDMDRPLLAAELTAFRNRLKRRALREPLAYITGTKEFYGRDFQVDRNVLIPRPESELLVDAAVRLAPVGATVLELGVGSGAVVLSVLLERPDLKAVASDISMAALAVARKNAQAHGLAERIRFAAADLLQPFKPKFALILMNPPYIKTGADLTPDVRDYEPAGALYGGKDGLDVIRRLIKRLGENLTSGGSLVMEIGFDQHEDILALTEETAGLAVKDVLKDLAGHQRTVILEKTRG